jgi:hypothetical protein
LNATVSTVPLPTEPPPGLLAEVETSGVVTAAAAAPENATISPAIAKTVESPSRAIATSPVDPLARRFLTVRLVSF